MSPINALKGVRNALLWSPKATRILVENISNEPMEKWETQIIENFRYV